MLYELLGNAADASIRHKGALMSILFFFYVVLFYFYAAIRHEVGIAASFVGSASLFGLSWLSVFIIFGLWRSAAAGGRGGINIL